MTHLKRDSQALLLALALLGFTHSASAQLQREPGGTPADVARAINEPFEYAWQLFLFLNQQAKLGSAGEVDPSKESIVDYNDDQPVVWETWASATGGLGLRPGEVNTSEVYRAKGAKPIEWSALARTAIQPKKFERTLTAMESKLKELMAPRNFNKMQEMGGLTPFFISPTDLGRDDEIRMNRATYDHIRDNYLYSVEGLQSSVKKAIDTGNRDFITFPLLSKEIKARWIQIKEADKSRYHWRSVTITKADGTKETNIWGLSGIHIITKDLPNWFWTDFEHVDQEQQAIKEGRPSVDPTTRGTNGQSAPSGNNGERLETKNSKWRYYRLRGTQLDFTDKFGSPTRLANTLIEPIEDGPSSCITCHAKATASLGTRAGAAPPFVIRTLPVQFVDGLPDPKSYFSADGKLQFIQTDFLWSMPFRAHSEKEQ